MAAVFEPVTADLRVRLLHAAATPPRRAHEHDAGYDLACVEGFTLWPARRRTVGTGVAIALPPGVAGLVTPRSGLASRHGITIVNAPGLVDPGYRGELRVTLLNTGDAPYARAPATASPSSCSCRSSCPTSGSSRASTTAPTTAASSASGPRALLSAPGAPDGERPRTGRGRIGRSGDDRPGETRPYGVMVNASELVRPRSSRPRPGVTSTAYAPAAGCAGARGCGGCRRSARSGSGAQARTSGRPLASPLRAGRPRRARPVPRGSVIATVRPREQARRADPPREAQAAHPERRASGHAGDGGGRLREPGIS